MTKTPDADLAGRRLAVVPTRAGDPRTAGRAQKQFNKLVDQLRAQRRELERWQAYRAVYQQRLAREYQPHATRLRDRRIALVRLLDRAMDGADLGRRERAKVRHLLGQALAELLAESQDAELIALHDKYAEVSFADEREQRMMMLRKVAHERYGIDADEYDGAATPEDLAEWLDERVRAAEDPPPADAAARKPRGKARAAPATSAEAGATRAIRAVFRRLASELHPDREQDAGERARKTELMKQVNQAYKAGDLMSLLELQLRIEQIDAVALAGLAEARLRDYVRVLQRQSQQLRDELAAAVDPFKLALGGAPARGVTPAAVDRALDADIIEVKAMVRDVEAELARFANPRTLKATLAQFRVYTSDEAEAAALREPAGSGHGRARR